MSVDIVAGWTEFHRGGDKIVIVIRDDDRVSLRRIPAKWSFFLRGIPDDDVRSLERDTRVRAMTKDGPFIRIDCRTQWDRRDLVGALQNYKERKNPDAEILEADVRPLPRLLADNPKIQVSETPRLIYLDIEVDSRHSIPSQKEGRARMLSWAIADADGYSKADVLEEDDDEAECRLFERLFEELAAYDCVLAWFGDVYDFEVIRERAEWLGVKPFKKGIPWHRWTWLDHAAVFKKYNMASDQGGEAKSSFALNHVAGYLLGEGKIDFDASKTWEAWRDDPEKLRAYNLQDTELLPRIEEKTGLIALHLAVCHVCRLLPDTNSLNATRQGDGFLLRLGAEHGYRWPTRERVENAEKFAGAYVMPPRRLGAVDDVHVCDFSGLYPSIIRTWNMSPDTKVAPEFFGKLEVPYGQIEPIDSEALEESGTCQLPTRHTFFRTDEDGMFRIALDTLVAKRAEYQAAMKKEVPGTPEHARAKRLQAAFKIVANSFYGILGSPFSRFFDTEIAEGVTQVGRWLLHEVIEEAKKRGLDPFYGDTDSVFIAGDVEEMKELVAHMNATWSDRLRPWGIGSDDPMHIDLDFEKTFSRIIIISAKRYAGRFIRYKGKDALPDAAPEVKGLEFKRGDTIRLARDMQVEIVNELLGIGKPFDTPLPKPKDIRSIFDRWKAKILEEELEADAVILSKSISKPINDYITRYTSPKCGECKYNFGSTFLTGPEVCPDCETPRKKNSPPQHVKVAAKMRDDGHEILVGNRIRYLMVRPDRDAKDRKPLPVPVYEPGAFERISREYYWERVGKASARVLEQVFPDDQWFDLTPEKKHRELKRRQAEFRGVVSDLPLFAAAGVEDLTTGKRTMKTRTRKKKTKGPTSQLSTADQGRIAEAVKSGSFDPAAYAIAHGVKAEVVSAYAKGIPREKRRRKKKSKPPAEKDERPRRRRRSVVVERIENTRDEDGGIEKFGRKRFFEALRETIEKHPGKIPVKLRIVLADTDRTPKVDIPTGLKIATTPEAREDLRALEGRIVSVSGWPA